MTVSDIAQLVRNANRFREVVNILIKYGLADWLHHTNIEWMRSLLTRSSGIQNLGELSREARIRKALTELGTTWIKMGQILSTRPDLVGPELADELAELRTSTPPDPPDAVNAIVQEELGAAPGELFAEFDEVPFASASIGQVHRAKLRDGTSVVVKVQHPGIEERIRNDLEILGALCELAEAHSDPLKQYRPVETAADFQRTLLKELDFRGEQRNMERFRRNFSDETEVRFPKPYPEFSSSRVLTMDFLEGINLSDGDALAKAQLDRDDLARRGAELFIQMIFRDAFYHADPHPGNLMVLRDDQDPTTQAHTVIGVLDCGMVGRLDEPLREDIESVLLAIVQADAGRIVDVIIRQGNTPDDLEVPDLHLDVEDFLDEYAHQSLNDFDLSGCLNGIIEIIRRHGIVLPAKIAMLLKVLIMLEGTAQQLSPRFSLAELIQPYGEKSVRDKFSPQRMFRKVASRYRDWDNLLEILPRDAGDILHRFKKGSFDVHLNHRRLETIVNRLVIGILSAALFVGSSLVLSRKVAPLFYGTSVPGIAGCLAALWLGARVVLAIRRSSADE